MELNAKIKWSFFIFNILHVMCSGCDYYNKVCYLNIYCSTGDISFRNYNNYHTNGDCSQTKIYMFGSNYIPVRVKIVSIEVVESFVREIKKKYYVNNLIVSLEITNTLLEVFPDLNEMANLKMLNLSNNNLQVAKLFNRAELTALEIVDLSHNCINSIQVDDTQYVYKSIHKLNLSHNLLKNIPGGVFEPFKNLEMLDLSNNNIIGIDYYSFEGSKNLKCLYLSYNNISEINASLFRFSNLEELSLDNNNIENLSVRDFETLRSLRTLNLDFNKISSIQNETFSNTKFLTTLKLHHNLLSHIPKDLFLATNSLNDIDLSKNLIQNLPKNLFTNKNITSFSITGNYLEGVISEGTFEGLQLISELDISYQAITAVEDQAFLGMIELTKLLLNNNQISTISEDSFKTLRSLKLLDLSYNLIISINFIKRDLVSLDTFFLSNNFIKEILRDDLQGLNRLRVLDISNNNISNIETGAFQYTQTIEALQLFKNPIRGALLNNSFDGLHLVPILDLSYTSINSIKNGSLSGMLQLQELNISRSSINKLEYGAFINTGDIRSIDLSFNKLKDFFVNGDDLQNLTTIYLNNNVILKISSYVFKHMSILNKIVLSYNSIQSIHDDCFADQKDLRYLDVSFNTNLTFHASAIKSTRTLEKLLLTGVENVTDFTYNETASIRVLDLSHIKIQNISALHLNSMRLLTNLVVSNNNIAKLECSALKNMSALDWLDLSFNNIYFIQPGTFKDNVFLHTLNISHNSLTFLNYGIFRGLVSLNLLDVSYNSISDLGGERFYDTQNLKILIADHNRIADISNNFGVHLNLLSIGHNLLSCEKVIYLKQINHYKVTAMNIDENNSDNIDGITCNMNNHNKLIELKTHITKLNTTMNERILLDIRDILLNFSQNLESQTSSGSNHIDILKKIFNKLDEYGVDQTTWLKEIKSEVSDEVNRTNSFLERILKVILGFGSLQNRLTEDNIFNVTSNKDNLTVVHYNKLMENHTKLDALVSDVNQLKQELLYMENVISEIDKKISSGRILFSGSIFEKLNKSDHAIVRDNNAGKSFIFLEVCVSIMLLMLICFIVYKCYEAKIFQQTQSLSTRNITDAMENSNL